MCLLRLRVDNVFVMLCALGWQAGHPFTYKNICPLILQTSVHWCCWLGERKGITVVKNASTLAIFKRTINSCSPVKWH